MFLFNPEGGMTLEQKIELAWNDFLSTSTQVRVLALAKATGRTHDEIILECRTAFLESLEDPVNLAVFHAKMEREAVPFGKDPLLS
jgi:predicted DNA-binding protein